MRSAFDSHFSGNLCDGKSLPDSHRRTTHTRCSRRGIEVKFAGMQISPESFQRPNHNAPKHPNTAKERLPQQSSFLCPTFICLRAAAKPQRSKTSKHCQRTPSATELIPLPQLHLPPRSGQTTTLQDIQTLPKNAFRNKAHSFAPHSFASAQRPIHPAKLPKPQRATRLPLTRIPQPASRTPHPASRILLSQK